MENVRLRGTFYIIYMKYMQELYKMFIDFIFPLLHICVSLILIIFMSQYSRRMLSLRKI